MQTRHQTQIIRDCPNAFPPNVRTGFIEFEVDYTWQSLVWRACREIDEYIHTSDEDIYITRVYDDGELKIELNKTNLELDKIVDKYKEQSWNRRTHSR